MACVLKRIGTIAAALLLACMLCFLGCKGAQSSDESSSGASSPTAVSAQASAYSEPAKDGSASSITVTEDGQYSDRDHVAAYIHEFGHLPSNFVSKTKARNAGWISTEGNLWDVLPGMSIGGSEFYIDEDTALPDAEGRRWTECDINYSGGYRGAERIVFSNNGLIFYTADHYNTFEQLY